MSIDCETLAVGPNSEDSNQNTITNGPTSSDNNSPTNSGAVYVVYTRSGIDWSQQAYIKPSNTVADGAFGYDVSLQGELQVVGAEVEDINRVWLTAIQKG